jgi:ferredoxin like protein
MANLKGFVQSLEGDGMNLEDKLYLIRFQPDNRSHIRIKDEHVCLTDCEKKWCTFICPAKVYHWEEKEIKVAYEGCIECGTCRYGCLFDNIEWENPRGGFGIMYKNG